MPDASTGPPVRGTEHEPVLRTPGGEAIHVPHDFDELAGVARSLIAFGKNVAAQLIPVDLTVLRRYQEIVEPTYERPPYEPGGDAYDEALVIDALIAFQAAITRGHQTPPEPMS